NWVKGRGVVEPFPVMSLFFAWLPRPLVSDSSGDRLLRWMDCNQRRYEPCRARSFIPSPSHRRTIRDAMRSTAVLLGTMARVPGLARVSHESRQCASRHDQFGWKQYTQ